MPTPALSAAGVPHKLPEDIPLPRCQPLREMFRRRARAISASGTQDEKVEQTRSRQQEWRFHADAISSTLRATRNRIALPHSVTTSAPKTTDATGRSWLRTVRRQPDGTSASLAHKEETPAA